MTNTCPNCKKEYDGNACMCSYGCVYATTSVSQIDKENGYNTFPDGTIKSVNLQVALQ